MLSAISVAMSPCGSMRANPDAGVNVGEHQVPQQRRLTRPGCTDEKDMTRAGFRREPELLAGSEGADLHMGNIRVHGPAAEPKRRCTGVALVAQCDVPILAWRMLLVCGAA